MSTLDWPAMMRLGMCGLHLSPRDFWSLTPGELLRLAGLEGGASMSRGGFDRLAEQFPDVRDNNKDKTT